MLHPALPKLMTPSLAMTDSAPSPSSQQQQHVAPPPSKKPPPPWASLATGGASGLASCLLLQPMDLLKTRVQQESREARRSTRIAAAAAAQAAVEKDGGIAGKRSAGAAELEGRTQRLVRIIKQIWAEEGPRGFWRGTAPTVARNVPGVALYFYSVSELRAIVQASGFPILALPASTPGALGANGKPSGSSSSALARLSTAGNLVTGAAARVSVGFLLSPITVVKAKMESNHFSRARYASLSSSLAHLWRTHGLRGYYQGFGATALRDAPYAGLYLAIYERCKAGFSSIATAPPALIAGDVSPKEIATNKQQNLAWVTSASGVVAGAIATLLTHPFDIVKTRIQTRIDSAELAAAASDSKLASASAATAAGTASSTTSRSASASASSPPHVQVAKLSTLARASASRTAPASASVRSSARSISTLAMTREILAKDGLQAFVDGLGLRCARKAASSAIGWSIFEVGTKGWTDYFHRRALATVPSPPNVVVSS